MKPLFTNFFAYVLVFLFSTYSAIGNTFTTIANGNWQNSSTWAGGLIPNPENIQNHVININHNVTVTNNNVKLVINARLNINNSEFIISNGNFIIEYGEVLINNSTVTIGGGHNLELTTCNARILVINSVVTVSQNFSNSAGFRILNNVCLTVHENYSNAGIDTLISVTAVIGSNSIGNLQNSNGLLYSDNSSFHLPNGNFQNSSGSLLSGNINAIWLENGNLQNSGNWWADINHYCVSGNVSVPASNLPAAQNCNTISSFFNSSSNCPGSGLNTCVITGPDQVCPGSNFNYSVTSVTGTYLWQISGDASIVGAANNSQVQIATDPNCNGTFTLTLNINGASVYSCTKTVAVVDTIMPHCNCPPVTTVPCGAPVVFTQPVITDNCGLSSISIYATYVLPQSNGTIYHVQVWEAIDLCGNTILSSEGIIELCGPEMITSFADPNPFEAETFIHFTPVISTEKVTVDVYNINGSKVATLFTGPANAGEVYRVIFNAKILPDGVYVYRIYDDKNYTYGKMILAK
ncbi:MAG: T9SS type A sorting domain-containing protein [Bacteroidia bacterium]